MEKYLSESTQRLSRTFEELHETLPSLEDIYELFQKFSASLIQAYANGEGLIEEDLYFILRAFRFAMQKHEFQYRKDPKQTPYIIHPLEVAYVLVEFGKVRDPDIIISGLLHDTLEDTSTTLSELLELFNQKIAGLVCELTDDKTLTKQERKQLQILNAPQKSGGAAQIILADKICNLLDLKRRPPKDWEDERVQAYFLWARQVVDRLPWVNAPLKMKIDELFYSTTPL